MIHTCQNIDINAISKLLIDHITKTGLAAITSCIDHINELKKGHINKEIEIKITTLSTQAVMIYKVLQPLLEIATLRISEDVQKALVTTKELVNLFEKSNLTPYKQCPCNACKQIIELVKKHNSNCKDAQS